MKLLTKSYSTLLPIAFAAVMILVSWSSCTDPVDPNCYDEGGQITPGDYCSDVADLCGLRCLNTRDVCATAQSYAIAENSDWTDAIEEDNGSSATFALSAPHGAWEEGTANIVEEVAGDINWQWLIFRHFRKDEMDTLNVNRPTHGRRPESQGGDRWDYRAAVVYQCYTQKVTDMINASNGNLKLFVEIHGIGSGDEIEVAKSSTLAHCRLQMHFNNAIQTVINQGNVPQDFINDMGVFVEEFGNEGNDDVTYHATGAKTCGNFCRLKEQNIHFLHLEVPKKWRLTYNHPNRLALIRMLKIALPAIAADLPQIEGAGCP